MAQLFKSPRPVRNTHRNHHHDAGLLTHSAVTDTLISLAGLVGRPVTNQLGSDVGRVEDVVARWDGGSYPPATGLVVKVGRRTTFLPITQVQAIEPGAIRLRSAQIDLRDFRSRTGEVVLGRDVLDRQLVDVDGVRVVRASDLYLAPIGSLWLLVGVDVGLQSLLRRIGPSRWRNRATPERVLDWSAVQPFGTANGELRLAHSNHALHRLRPAELANLLEELGRGERQELLGALEPGDAADALEEMQPEELGQLLRDAPAARAAELVAAMEPDEAIDALRDFDPATRDAILCEMVTATADELRSLLNYREETAGGLMTTHLVMVPPSATVGMIREVLRERRDHRGDIDRVLVVDDDNHPLDDIGLSTLLIATDDTLMSALVSESGPATVNVHAGLDAAVSCLTDSRATSLVVTDDDDHPVGRILADDLIDALLPERAKLRFPRILR